MTSIFNAEGRNVPCTVLEVGPCTVSQIKTEETDGYKAVQISYGEKKDKHATKPETGHFKKAGTTPKKKVIELKGFVKDWKAGDVITVDYFKDDPWVDVVGISKGKGFQGVVKRYNFKGVNDQTHGQHNRQRHPGSIGASSDPSRVMPGMRMAGRMGGDRVKLLNLKVVKIIPEKNLMLVKGAVPGHNGSYIIVEK